MHSGSNIGSLGTKPSALTNCASCQGPRVSFKESDLYAPVLKATEARLLLTLAAAEVAKVVKPYTNQTFCYGNMGNDVVYIRTLDR